MASSKAWIKQPDRGATRRRPRALAAVLTLVLWGVLTMSATIPAEAVTVDAAPTWPISNAYFGPPPVPSMPTAGGTAPPTEAISDPVTAGAICGPWHQQGNYGNRWAASSTWWEYSCSREETYYDDGCPPVGVCDYSNEIWEYQIWTDYFYWNGSEAVFYGEAYTDSWYCCGGFSGTDDYWWDSWDASSARWYNPTGTPPPTVQQLTVSKPGSGSGTVTSNPAGIDCGTTCVADFPPGTAVTLTASPDGSSSTFTGWSGACTGTALTCQLAMDQARSVSAAFAVDTPPHAGMTIACTGLACTFDASPSTDAEGPIARYQWAFGDGASATGRTATLTYPQPGAYQVTLTVTDSVGATATVSKTINPIALTARGYKQNGAGRVALSWTGPSGTSYAVYRNGTKVAATSPTSYTDNLGTRMGTFTYRVCVPAEPICSNNASVTL